MTGLGHDGGFSDTSILASFTGLMSATTSSFRACHGKTPEPYLEIGILQGSRPCTPSSAEK